MKATLFTAALLFAVSLPASAADLKIDFDNIETPKGTIMIAVYNSAEGFLAPGGAIAFGRAAISDSSASYEFPDLEPGTYAVSVFHDLDGDGELAKNSFGAPEEPYGMSNDARGLYGPPTFEDTAFELTADGASIRIRLD